MAVRAKFRLNSYTVDLHLKHTGKDERGVDQYENVEKRTLNFTPVYSNDPNHENRQFWNASPSGSIQLGVVNQEAWKHFEIGKEYYLDFTLAE